MRKRKFIYPNKFNNCDKKETDSIILKSDLEDISLENNLSNLLKENIKENIKNDNNCD